MEFKLDPEAIHHLDSLKLSMTRNPSEFGYEHDPGIVHDIAAIEFAVTFTAQFFKFRKELEQCQQGFEDL